MTEASSFRCGYVALVGRPNVGKSTLMNRLIEQKISITSRKPQTTRHSINGIKTTSSWQMIFVDTPGQHSVEPRAINRYMNRVARSRMHDVDVIVLVLDRLKWSPEDQLVAERAQASGKPLVVALNKLDRLQNVELLLPHIAELSQVIKADYVPISALRGTNLDQLEAAIVKYLPEAPAQYPEDQVTDRSTRFVVAEMIREKIIRQLGEELPYATTVEIEQFIEEERLIQIDALIYVEREGQKRILIGEGGSRLKQIGIEARKDIERLTGQRVMLKLWVKVRSGWSDDERALLGLGYIDSI